MLRWSLVGSEGHTFDLVILWPFFLCRCAPPFFILSSCILYPVALLLRSSPVRKYENRNVGTEEPSICEQGNS